MSQDFLKKLDEKENQINLLNEYVDNLKTEFRLYREHSTKMLNK